jgi:hypothetical protein
VISSPLAFLPITPYTFLLSPIRATCPAHLILLELVILIILVEDYKSRSSSLCNFLHPLITLFNFGPNVPLSTIVSNTLSLWTSFIRDKFSHRYRTSGKIIFWYILRVILSSLKEDEKKVSSGLNGSKHYQTSMLSDHCILFPSILLYIISISYSL